MWNIFGKKKEETPSPTKVETTNQVKKEINTSRNEEPPKPFQEQDLDSNDIGSPEELKTREEKTKTVYAYKLLNGRMPSDDRDCLGCKIVATTTPIGISGYLFYHLRKIDKNQIPDTFTRRSTKAMYGAMIFGFLWCSVLSATGGWLAKESDESWLEYMERDTENQKRIFKGIKTYISEKMGSKS